MAGPVYRYNDALQSASKLPKEYDHCLFIYEWSRNWIIAVKLDENNQIRLGKIESRELAYTSFSQLLDGKADVARLRDKVVVIAYDGSKMHALTTSAGPVKAHRLFYIGLLDAWSQLVPGTSP